MVKGALLIWMLGLSVLVNSQVVKEENENEGPFIEEKKSSLFLNGFVTTFSVIVVSELGDKTFFIAALMAMKHSRRLVLCGALVALSLMHVGSCLFGYLFAFVPRLYLLLVSSGLFAFFGLKLLWEGWRMERGSEASEMKEVSQEIQKQEEQESEHHLESQTTSSFLAPFLQTCTMTFFAEWGDRSQIATIVLGARENLSAVVVGGLLGHFVCSGLAVLGGRLLSSKISVKSVTLLGGFIFLLFSFTTLIMNDLDK